MTAAHAQPHGPRAWPWRGPDPVRNTLAVALPLPGLVLLVVWLMRSGRDLVGLAWILALTFTLMFAGDLAWTRGGPRRLRRVVLGLTMLCTWFLLYRVLAR